MDDKSTVISCSGSTTTSCFLVSQEITPNKKTDDRKISLPREESVRSKRQDALISR